MAKERRIYQDILTDKEVKALKERYVGTLFLDRNEPYAITDINAESFVRIGGVVFQYPVEVLNLAKSHLASSKDYMPLGILEKLTPCDYRNLTSNEAHTLALIDNRKWDLNAKRVQKAPETKLSNPKKYFEEIAARENRAAGRNAHMRFKG